jgi:hypothetical protein
MGSDEAYSILAGLGETEYANYPDQMLRLRSAIAELGDDQWRRNSYWSWLHALRALTSTKGESYPEYMRSAAWARKDLSTALSSWAELKHDTILYAKPNETKTGYAGPDPQRSHVEPNPLLFARLLDLVRLTRSGLESYELLTEPAEPSDPLWRTLPDVTLVQLLDSLEEQLSFFVAVSQQELAGETISEEDSSSIQWISGWLWLMSAASADVLPAEETEWIDTLELQEEPAAIVADVSTGGQAPTALTVATGPIHEIYVVTPDAAGGWQLASGGVYSFYEFERRLGEQLTDAEWREMLAAGEQPDQPEWTGAFIVE